MKNFNEMMNWLKEDTKKNCPELYERTLMKRAIEQKKYEEEEKYLMFIINNIDSEEVEQAVNSHQVTPVKPIDQAEGKVSNDDIKAVEIELEESKANNKVTLNISRTHNKVKPTGEGVPEYLVGKIQNELKIGKETIDINELINEIAQGATIKAAAMNGGSNVDWESQQVFCIDIDNDNDYVTKNGMLTPVKAFGRCDAIGIRPTFIYETFSSKAEHPKFRLMFITPEPVTDARIRNSIQIALMNVFPECDIKCKDFARVYFGSPNKICSYTNISDRIDPYRVIEGMVYKFKQRESASNALKKITKYCEMVGLNMVNGLPDVKYIIENDNDTKMEKTRSVLYIYYRGERKVSKIQYNFNIELGNALINKIVDTNAKRPVKIAINKNKVNYKDEIIQRFDFEQLENKCELWADFINGSIRLKHGEVFGISTNMWRVKGAETRMVEAIEKNSDYGYKANNKINTVRSCGSYGYAPQRCSAFCRYYEQCPNNQINMLTAVNNKRGHIRKVEDATFREVQDIRNDMATEFNSIINNLEDTKINIIKAPTGIGKTEMLKGIEDYRGMCIAVPTHKLAKEEFERLNIPKAILANDIELSDKITEDEYKHLQSIGNYKDAYKLLEAYRNNLNAIKDNMTTAIKDESSLITRYLDMQKEIHITTKPIICTHSKLLNLNNKKISTYIIDEDIIKDTLFKTVPLSVDEIDKLIAKAKIINANTLVSAFTTLKNSIENSRNNSASVTTVPAIHYSEKEMNQFIEEYSAGLTVNIQYLLLIKKILTDTIGNTLGAIKNELPEGRIIVLSATANEIVYRGFFDREVNFIDLGIARPKGNIIHHNHGFSRSFLNKNVSKALEIVKKEAPEVKNLITFKSYQNHFTKIGLTPITNFGATTGIDAYGGQDLIIAGTPHIPDTTYKLLASFIAPDAQIITDCEYQNVKRNGYEFYFNTFNSNINTPTANILQEIQFYMIEAELVQSVGRARALNNNCTVHVFSNYPLVESVLYAS